VLYRVDSAPSRYAVPNATDHRLIQRMKNMPVFWEIGRADVENGFGEATSPVGSLLSQASDDLAVTLDSGYLNLLKALRRTLLYG
jgi:hypothetical protein